MIEHGMALVPVRVTGVLTVPKYLELARPALRIATTLDNVFSKHPAEYDVYCFRNHMDLTFADVYEIKLQQLHDLDRRLRAAFAN